jgi:Domain of unknown function (DUF4157)
MTFERTTAAKQPASPQPASQVARRPAVTEAELEADLRLTSTDSLAQAESRFHRDFTQIPVHSSSHSSEWRRQPSRMQFPIIQPKLAIGAATDQYEQEADRIAHQVVQQLNTPNARQASPVQASPVQPIEPEIKLEEEEENKLWLKPSRFEQANSRITTATPALEHSIQQLRGNGQPLAASIQQPMERAFAADFSQVKVHTDTRSDQLSRSIQARAFTTGQDIFFQQGAYVPGSPAGQELIAHELTHVLQQNESIRQAGQLRQSGQFPAVKQVHSSDSSLQTGLLPKAVSQTAASLVGLTLGAVEQDTSTHWTGLIQRDLGVQVHTAQENDKSIITAVNVVDRPPKAFPPQEGDHTTAWAVIRHMIIRKLLGQTLLEAWQIVKDLCEETKLLPGYARIKYLHREVHQYFVYNLENAEFYVKQYSDYTNDKLAGMEANDLHDDLQKFIAWFLQFRNAIPFSVVAGEGKGKNERQYMEWLRILNGDHLQKLKYKAMAVPPDLQDETKKGGYLLEAVLGVFDAAGAAKLTMSDQTPSTVPGVKVSYEKPKKKFDVDQIEFKAMEKPSTLHPEFGTEDVTATPDIRMNEDEMGSENPFKVQPTIKPVADLIAQHLITIRSAFPNAYKDLIAKVGFSPTVHIMLKALDQNGAPLKALMNFKTLDFVVELCESKLKGYVEKTARDKLPDKFKDRQNFIEREVTSCRIRLNKIGVIEQVEIIGRPPKAFGSKEGDHTTAWTVITRQISNSLRGQSMHYAWFWMQNRYQLDQSLPGMKADRVAALQDVEGRPGTATKEIIVGTKLKKIKLSRIVGTKAKSHYTQAQKALDLIASSEVPAADQLLAMLQQFIQAYLHFRGAVPLSVVFNERERGSTGSDESNKAAKIEEFEALPNPAGATKAEKEAIIKEMWGLLDIAAVTRLITTSENEDALKESNEATKAPGVQTTNLADTILIRAADAIGQHMISMEVAFPLAFRVLSFDSKESIESFLLKEGLDATEEEAEEVIKLIRSHTTTHKTTHSRRSTLAFWSRVDRLLNLVKPAWFLTFDEGDFILSTAMQLGKFDASSYDDQTKYYQLLDDLNALTPAAYCPVLANVLLSKKIDEIKKAGAIVKLNLDPKSWLISQVFNPDHMISLALLNNFSTALSGVGEAQYCPVFASILLQRRVTEIFNETLKDLVVVPTQIEVLNWLSNQPQVLGENPLSMSELTLYQDILESLGHEDFAQDKGIALKPTKHSPKKVKQ